MTPFLSGTTCVWLPVERSRSAQAAMSAQASQSAWVETSAVCAMPLPLHDPPAALNPATVAEDDVAPFFEAQQSPAATAVVDLFFAPHCSAFEATAVPALAPQWSLLTEATAASFAF